MLTLWDLLPKALRPQPKPAPAPPRRAEPKQPRAGAAVARTIAKPGSPAKQSAQARYDSVVREMLAKYDVKVRKWRTSMSGVAYLLEYRDGSTKRLIEAPRPKGPMSIAVFLHEIGHHAIGLGAYKPRCLEEYHAWMFAIRAMEEHNLNITDSVRRRMSRSLKYAVDKAQRRGIRELPPELLAYCR